MEHDTELASLLNEHSSLNIVVSSSHREGRTLEGVRALFREEVRSRIIGTTPSHAMGRADAGRQREIEDWLLRYAPEANWVAVDDEKRLFERGNPRLVVTHPLIGWDQDTTEAVELVLGLSSAGRRALGCCRFR